MTDEEFLPKLREAFAIEAKEHLQAMTSGLLELEKSPDAARRKTLIESIYREAHSLKGAAGVVNRSDVQSVCQAMEDVFSDWKRKPVRIPVESFDTLSDTTDLIGRLLRMPDVAALATDREQVSEVVRRLSRLPHAVAPQPLSAEPESPKVAPEGRRTTEPHLELPKPPSIPNLPVPEPPPEAEAPQLADAVRVRMVKMDSLLRKAEEMVAVKLTASQHVAEVRGLGEVLGEWRSEWGRVRDLARPGLVNQSASVLEKLGAFLEWNQGYMRSLEKRLSLLSAAVVRDERGVGLLVDDLLTDAKRLVMLPFGTVLDLLPKMTRDIARAGGKEVSLTLQGREVEIDKRILQDMKDPLIHLVRNSVDHGIEKPAHRVAARKPACGLITVAVSQRDAGKIEILVKDDGGGISAEMVKASAIRAGTLAAEEAAQLDDTAALAHIFDSGVSTSPIITEISGRGLGMAIVRDKVEKLGGSISIESVPGTGTTFRIVLPVTLATFKGILVGSGGQSLIIPTVNVWRIKRIRSDEIQTVENRATMLLDGQPIAFVRLDEVLELPSRAVAKEDGYADVLVLGAADKRIGFAVDEIQLEQEVLVKNLGKPLLRVRNVAGATVLQTGTPAVILNVADLLKSAVRHGAGGSAQVATPSESSATPEMHARRVLVADDSVTSRMLLKNILESSGYQVATAVDGMDALMMLKSREFDIVVSDVEMPRMDGFDLTAKIRADKKLAELPVVLVTALGSREHQERGIDVGADAYIVKSSFDQKNLLEIIRKLV
jgi:two-component system chemotaxis sensor kinase CheA